MRANKYSCKHDEENIEKYRVTPLETGVTGFTKLVNYFEYKAPLIDSIHSTGSCASLDRQAEVLKKMLSESDMLSRTKFLKIIQKNSLELLGLEGSSICIKCPRMICKIRKDETELSCILRHLRNGFAHGRTYVKGMKNQTYIIIDDEDKGKCTARIVITKAILVRWYKLISSEGWSI